MEFKKCFYLIIYFCVYINVSQICNLNGCNSVTARFAGNDYIMIPDVCYAYSNDRSYILSCNNNTYALTYRRYNSNNCGGFTAQTRSLSVGSQFTGGIDINNIGNTESLTVVAYNCSYCINCNNVNVRIYDTCGDTLSNREYIDNSYVLDQCLPVNSSWIPFNPQNYSNTIPSSSNYSEYQYFKAYCQNGKTVFNMFTSDNCDETGIIGAEFDDNTCYDSRSIKVKSIYVSILLF